LDLRTQQLGQTESAQHHAADLEKIAARQSVAKTVPGWLAENGEHESCPRRKEAPNDSDSDPGGRFESASQPVNRFRSCPPNHIGERLWIQVSCRAGWRFNRGIGLPPVEWENGTESLLAARQS
jgi:hypothetical protein